MEENCRLRKGLVMSQQTPGTCAFAQVEVARLRYAASMILIGGLSGRTMPATLHRNPCRALKIRFCVNLPAYSAGRLTQLRIMVCFPPDWRVREGGAAGSRRPGHASARQARLIDPGRLNRCGVGAGPGAVLASGRGRAGLCWR